MFATSALVMPDPRAWSVSRIAVRVLVLLRAVWGVSYELNCNGGRNDWNLRVPRAIGATRVLATLADLGPGEQFLALATRSPDTLSGLPVVKVLASCLGRPLKDDLLRSRIPVRDNGCLLGPFLDDGRPLLAALLLLGLGALRGDARALLATRVRTVRAFPVSAKRGAAEMALPVHPHPDRLLDAEGVALGLVPLARRQFQTVEFAELLRPLREDLRSRDLGGFHGRGNFCHGRGLTVTTCQYEGQFVVNTSPHQRF